MTLHSSVVRLMMVLAVCAGVGCGPGAGEPARESAIEPRMPELSRAEAVGLLARLYAQEDDVVLRAMEEIAAVGDSRSWPRLSVQKCLQAGAPAVPDFLCFEVEGASLRFSRELGERWQRGFASIRETKGEAEVITVAQALDRVLELLYRDALRELSADDALEASSGILLAGAAVNRLVKEMTDTGVAEEFSAREKQWRARGGGGG